MMPQKITPNIWFDGDAETAGEFYASVLPGASAGVESRYPTEGLLEFQLPLAGAPLTVGLQLPDPAEAADPMRFVLINAGPEFRPNPSISFMLNFDPLMFGGDEAARARMELTWRGLSDGGEALMPLGEYPFASLYGWVQDRFGVNWQLMLTRPEGEPRPFVIPALMFDGAAQDRAAEAADLYVSLFDGVAGGAAVGHRSPYGRQAGKAGPDALAFGEFRIGPQWFMAADNGSGVDHGFSCGVSLQVDCDDQAEIDRLWDALSAVPEAEQCGWLVDPFGVSWQIVPRDMEALLSRPGAYERMMQMHKIVIADL